MKLKRFGIYNYNGLTVKLVGFTTDRVWFDTPMKFNRVLDKKVFMSKAKYLKDKPKKVKSKRKFTHKPVRPINIYYHGRLMKECESVKQAIEVTGVKLSTMYKAIENNTMTKTGYTFKYANAKEGGKVYKLYMNGKFIGKPTNKKEACELLGCSRPTLNMIIDLGEHKGRKVIVEEIKC